MTEQREKLSAEELAIVLSHYDLGLVQEVREFARGSHRAPKVTIRTDRGRFILKRRPAGKNDPYRVAFAHELQNYLAKKNFPLPHLIGTKEGNISMLRLGDHVYEVFEFIPGERYDGGLVATYEAGKVLGLYHRLVREYHPKWTPPRGHYHNSPVVRQQLKEIPVRLPAKVPIDGKEKELESVCAQLRDTYDNAAVRIDKLGLPKWEMQIVHSDWHPGNMLFREGHVVAVIDYDAARIQPRITDMANGVLQFSLQTGSRDPETWPAEPDESRSRRFIRGYDEMDQLSLAELDTIPLLMVEALIAEVSQPIWTHGTFARIDGFRFLKMVVRKTDWLMKFGKQLTQDLKEAT